MYKSCLLSCFRSNLKPRREKLWLKRTQKRGFCCHPRRRFVLGIESSCDDTGAAVVSSDGKVIGEALHSQHEFHLALGGINPPFARDLHKECISKVVNSALEASNMKFEELDAVATTVKPGLPLSLEVGLNYTKSLLRKHQIPFIPIHHMEAHALTVRMIENVPFPFLVLLISGGHCLLAVAKSVEEFLLLGDCMDDAPGEAFDKTARRLKLKNMPECSSMNGGQAIEFVARNGDPNKFEFPSPMWKHMNCQFSFAGLKFKALKHIMAEERTHGTCGDEIIPGVADLCASFQNSIARHIFRRLHRGMAYCELMNLMPENAPKTLVVSGGVACNKYIKCAIEHLCECSEYKLVCPPPHLCTDNGIMIAWNGMEKLLAGIGLAEDPQSVRHFGKYPFGTSLKEQVTNSGAKGTRIKFDVNTILSKLKEKYPHEYS